MYFSNGQRITPISPLGFVVATLGAFVLLFFYRLLGGRFFVEGERGTQIRMPHYRPAAPLQRAAHRRLVAAYRVLCADSCARCIGLCGDDSRSQADCCTERFARINWASGTWLAKCV